MLSHSTTTTQPCTSVAQTQHAAPITLLSDAEFRQWLKAEADRLAWTTDDDDSHFEDFAPSWDAPSYEPSPEAAAEDAGYARGYALDLSAVPPADMPAGLRHAWLLGKLDGMFQRKDDDDERAAFEADLAESAFAYQERHPSEVVRAVGVVASRAEGGAL
jgi:hypothetical protein